MDHIDEFPFEAGAGITHFLGKFAQEQWSAAYSPEETDFTADHIEQSVRAT
jgi:hypothetical protein